MTAFCELPEETRLLLAGILLFAAATELALGMYRYVCSGRWNGCVVPALVILPLLMLIAAATGRATALSLPWMTIPLLSLGTACHAVIGIRRERRHWLSRLSPDSVRETLDDLNAGVCFADETGRVILVNHMFDGLAGVLIGNHPQTLGELTDALETPPDCVEILPGRMYRLPDGGVWRFRVAKVAQGVTQITAQDVTGIYDTNCRLQQENDSLRKTNEQLRDAYEQLADRIREEETLRLKMRVHNEIGASLITISALMDGGSDEELQTQLERLSDAVGYFRGAAEEDDDGVRRQARTLGVAIHTEGEPPKSGPARGMLLAAVRECVTNCVRHAGGNNVYVKISEKDGSICAALTNDGAPPAEDVTEGGGLSALRQKIERGGGTMKIISRPAFSLILTFPKEDDL